MPVDPELMKLIKKKVEEIVDYKISKLKEALDKNPRELLDAMADKNKEKLIRLMQ